MECPICFEAVTLRRLVGCRHHVCQSCYPRIATPVEPFGPYVWLPVEFNVATCPECRHVEPSPVSPAIFDALCKHFPLGHRIWFETTLFSDADGTFYYTSHRKRNARVFPATTDPYDTYAILDRVCKGLRTQHCMLDDKDLWQDPEYVLLWVPIPRVEPCPYKVEKGAPSNFSSGV